MRKKYLLLTMFVLMLVFTSCSMSLVSNSRINRAATQNFFEGTEGLVVEFVEQAPPTEIYESGDFDVQVLISNAGAFSLAEHYVAKLNLIYDSSKVKKITDKTVGYYRDSYAKDGIVLLYGKSYYYPSGETNYFPIDRFKANDVPMNFETSNVGFSVDICYPYETTFADSICIDSDPQKVDIRDDACQIEDKHYSKGQGAPLEITAVDVQMIPRGTFVQPRFMIHLNNAAGGLIYDFNESALEKVQVEINSRMEDRYTCGDFTNIEPNRMQIEAYLGEEKLDCTLAELRAKDSRIECQLSESKIPGNVANYMTSLRINLKYFYSQLYSTETEIKQSDANILSNIKPLGASYCPAWQTYDDVNDNCVDNCESYAATNQAKLIEDGLELPQGQAWGSLGCNYATPDSCRSARSSCTLASGLCMKGEYCGWPECIDDNSKPSVYNIIEQGSLKEVSWHCKDSDDFRDKQKTCGCSEDGYYLFVEQGTNCRRSDVSLFNSIKGTSGPAGIIYDVVIPDDNSTKLCIAVKDKLGEFSQIESVNI